MTALLEVVQKPYVNGSRVEQGTVQSIEFGPGGFRLVDVLSGDLSGVLESNEVVRRGQDLWPAKTSLHLDVRDPACDQPFRFREQQRVKKGRKGHPTKGTLAIFVARGIRKALDQPNFRRFPYRLDQLVVTCVEIRSKGTIQPKISRLAHPGQHIGHQPEPQYTHQLEQYIPQPEQHIPQYDVPQLEPHTLQPEQHIPHQHIPQLEPYLYQPEQYAGVLQPEQYAPLAEQHIPPANSQPIMNPQPYLYQPEQYVGPLPEQHISPADSQHTGIPEPYVYQSEQYVPQPEPNIDQLEQYVHHWPEQLNDPVHWQWLMLAQPLEQAQIL